METDGGGLAQEPQWEVMHKRKSPARAVLHLHLAGGMNWGALLVWCKLGCCVSSTSLASMSEQLSCPVECQSQ